MTREPQRPISTTGTDALAIKPIVDCADNNRRSLPQAVRYTFWLSLGCLLLLEVWRPFYFLSDDNLTYSLPLMVTIGKQMWRGDTPFINPYLFGGDYNLLRDPNSLSLWNPLVFSTSLLANTSAYLAIADIYVGFNLVVCATAFAYLLCRMRQWRKISISNGRVILLSLSYTFSAYALVVGSSWQMYTGNQAALPILMLGFLHPQRQRGIGLVVLGLLYTLLLGHLSPFLFTLLFLTAFVLAHWLLEGSPETLWRWAAGGTCAAILMLPLLLPAFGGFSGTSRSSAMKIETASMNALPLPVFITSFLGGSLGAIPGIILGLDRVPIGQSFASCAASWLIVGGLWVKRKFTSLETSLAICALMVALFVMRPYWLAFILHHIPLYSSLRWPFREIFVFLFFTHLWIGLRLAGLTPRWEKGLIAGSTALFLLSQLTQNPWSFAPMYLDRQLVTSGLAAAYWQQLKTQLRPGDTLISIIPVEMLKKRRDEIPFSLLGAYNYPALYEVRSASGYTAGGLASPTPEGIAAYEWSGVFTPEDGARLLARNPQLKALRLMSLSPVRISLCTAHTAQDVTLPPLPSIKR